MDLTSIILPDMIIANLKANSKKQVLHELAELAAKKVACTEHEILDTLLQRERLGSTGTGNGVAIPHGKLPNLDGIVGAFARVSKPIAFDAIDDQPVDLFFMLLAPEGSGADHLKALSKIARILRDEEKLNALRSAQDVDGIYETLIAEVKANAA
jgi:PTS system nitrogen regulatory IIA component